MTLPRNSRPAKAIAGVNSAQCTLNLLPSYYFKTLPPLSFLSIFFPTIPFTIPNLSLQNRTPLNPMPNPNATTPQTHGPDPSPNPNIPLHNLSLIQTRLDSLHRFLSESINSNTLLTNHQISVASNDIVSSIHQIIVNAASLISAANSPYLTPAAGNLPVLPLSPYPKPCLELPIAGKVSDPPETLLSYPRLEFQVAGNFPVEPEAILSERSLKLPIAGKFSEPPEAKKVSISDKGKQVLDLKTEVEEDEDVEIRDEDCEIVELDAVELLAEHIHFCEICGKGFRRDANLRMHMRAHGNQFKTPEALAKPPEVLDDGAVSSSRGRATRFSCPFEGCNRNKRHKKFKALKSMVCVKNHFKRSHCPKMYSCNRCHKKNFSVLSDLRSHMKQCGEYSKWKCSCGTTFSRKDKLFGHIALFEGHMPALGADEEEKGKKAMAAGVEDENEDEDLMLINDGELGNSFIDDWLFDDLDKLDSFASLDFPSI
ncbi:hypothetical protein RIF29_08628 [Crotalaria pallida]|uniref:C2H2-type domain-containing protein n=1 Tax=Crotalaria pallida TaxID=3830 RepID=A0AAN9IHF5_CROPI